MFKLENIKAGYLLRCTDQADGHQFNMTVVPGVDFFAPGGPRDGALCCCNPGLDWCPLRHFKDALTYGSTRVDEVWGHTDPKFLLDNSTECRKLLWKRDTTKRMTLEEIEKALGHKVEVVSSTEI